MTRSASDMLAKYAPVARCDRRTFTKIKRGPRAVQFCLWCSSFLKTKDACPVTSIILPSSLPQQAKP